MCRSMTVLLLAAFATSSWQVPAAGAEHQAVDLDNDGLDDVSGALVFEQRVSGGAQPEAPPARPLSGGRLLNGDRDGEVHLTDSGNDIGGWLGASTCWGDYDGDGDLDLLIVGGLMVASPPQTTKIFMNDGLGNLTDDTSQNLIGICGGKSSSGWADIDRDGDLDLFLSGYDGTQYRTVIYRNDGLGGFTLDGDQNLMEVTSSSTDWGDFDNDGDLDLIFIGTITPYPFDPRTKLYLNNGLGILAEDTSQSLTNVCFGDVEWGDFDSDGQLDLAISGCRGMLGDAATILYRNDGDGNLVQWQELQGLLDGTVAWGDYDHDGNLDLIIAGGDRSSGHDVVYSIVYHNDGTGVFSEDTSQNIEPLTRGSAAWCDYDNDGDLDLAIAGFTYFVPGSASRLYYNNGSGTLIEDTSQDIIPTGSGSLAWGDYDDDGDVDLVVVGSKYLGDNNWLRVGKVYNNDASDVVGANTPPLPPTVLSATAIGGGILFEWNGGWDVETDANALTYNLRVGSVPGGCDVYYALASEAYNKPHFGNCWHALAKLLDRTSAVGRYYWSVQTIDNGLERSGWAPEQIAVKGDCDHDGDVDLADFATFAACFRLAGPYPPYCTASDLVCFDLDGNGIVNLEDFTTFTVNFTG